MKAVLPCLIYMLLSYAIVQGCNDSVSTVKFVGNCPVNSTEWTVRATVKACNLVNQTCTSPSNFRYHCLMNPWRDSYIEVCAPARNLIGGFCPEFNLLGSRIQNNYHTNCTKFSPPCPAYYRSTDVYKYKECFRLITTSETTMSSRNEKDVKKMANVTSRPTGSDPHQDNSSLILPVGLGIAGTIIIIAVIIAITIFLLKRGNSATQSTQDTKYSIVYSAAEKDEGT